MSQKRFLVQVISNVIGFALIGALFSGVHFSYGWVSIVVGGIIFGILNFFLKPILKVLSLPFLVVTLGIFSIMINIALLYLAAALVPGFSIDTFWTAVLATVILGIVNTIVFWIIPD